MRFLKVRTRKPLLPYLSGRNLTSSRGYGCDLAAYEDVRSNKSETNWLVIKYEVSLTSTKQRCREVLTRLLVQHFRQT